jgi:Uma2 family endonuclease
MPLDAATRKWAYEDMPAYPEGDGHRREFIAGEFFEYRFSSSAHQELLGRLVLLLAQFSRAYGLGKVILGPVGVVLGIGDYVGPDLVFIRADRKDSIGRLAIEGPPDLIVEVAHEITEARDRGIKRERYAHYGVPEYWILDPARHQIEVYRSDDHLGTATVLSSGSFDWQPVAGGPSLTVDIEELFDDLEWVAGGGVLAEGA